ncbi:hypothetical protein DM02DRAFT_74010 [Periconia macrospinosa]|uniref:Uncharacterized protein n=1 Tax=Periconia macrospinosa TaxID=97972 RepID=A0A2V1DJ93_9PLEO|nr:hypothetical protein DM02DRAFT_74010 [Periconia macrospinosa]
MAYVTEDLAFFCSRSSNLSREELKKREEEHRSICLAASNRDRDLEKNMQETLRDERGIKNESDILQSSFDYLALRLKQTYIHSSLLLVRSIDFLRQYANVAAVAPGGIRTPISQKKKTTPSENMQGLAAFLSTLRPVTLSCGI